MLGLFFLEISANTNIRILSLVPATISANLHNTSSLPKRTSESVVEKETVKKYLVRIKEEIPFRGNSANFSKIRLTVNSVYNSVCIFHELVTSDGKENRTLGQRMNACLLGHATLVARFTKEEKGSLTSLLIAAINSCNKFKMKNDFNRYSCILLSMKSLSRFKFTR